MIDKIILHNFQSHAHTEIDFSHGINSIIGPSNNGKSTIFRGFEWARTNRPTGLDFASHWATQFDKHEKLYLTDDVYVAVIFSEGKYVTREKRSDGFNGYHIGNYENGEFVETEEFGKVGVDVPHQVTSVFNMDNVNIQHQFDSMFLLSDTGQDVARYFNRLIKLDVSDAALSLIASKKRLHKRERDGINKEIADLNKKIADLQWIDSSIEQCEKISRTDEKITGICRDFEEIDTLLANMEAVEPFCTLPEYHERAEMALTRIEIFDNKIEKLDDIIYEITVMENDIETVVSAIKNSDWISEAREIVSFIDKITPSIVSLQNEMDSLDSTIFLMEQRKEKMLPAAYSEKALECIEAVSTLDNKVFSTSEQIDEIDMLISRMETCNQKIKERQKHKEKLESELPDQCTLCGAPLVKGVYHEAHP